MSHDNGEGMFMMPTDEQEKIHNYEMVCAAPDGLGYGEGTISARDRETNPDYPVTPEELKRAIEVILNGRDQIIVPVEVDDDGCGDGRPTTQIQQLNPETGELNEFRVSKKRAKIFGGGLQVASSMWRAVAGEALEGETVLGDRQFIAEQLAQRGVHYGAHTDNHAEGENCGCGAIDKYPISTQLSGKYQAEITQTLGVFYDNPTEDAGVQQAFATRAKIAGDAEYMSNASGRQTMDFIIGDGAVVKELGDLHLEAIVIMNDEPGTTVDQEKIAELLRAAGLPDTIQVFVVDVWRGRMYADEIADIAAERGYDREQSQQTAIADFFINQLSVAATLTKGDIPVILNS